MKKKEITVIIFLLILIIFSAFFCRSLYESFEGEKEETEPTINSTSSGIHKTLIPKGDEDLYILKSQVVPPVCPACPPVIPCNKEPPPPCPACARCPEPSFECKKVPNYRSNNTNSLPVPVLTSFSTFGM
jgi:hypothetical protein